MGLFTDGNENNDELFDLFVLNEIHEGENRRANINNSGGGCLTCLLLIIAIPVSIVAAAVSTLM